MFLNGGRKQFFVYERFFSMIDFIARHICFPHIRLIFVYCVPFEQTKFFNLAPGVEAITSAPGGRYGYRWCVWRTVDVASAGAGLWRFLTMGCLLSVNTWIGPKGIADERDVRCFPLRRPAFPLQAPLPGEERGGGGQLFHWPEENMKKIWNWIWHWSERMKVQLTYRII